jgi:alpha-beta hydrolase superfamily lysophospholipase
MRRLGLALLNSLRLAWRYKFLSSLAVILLLLLMLNVCAYLQARAMTHFSPGATRTPKPEQLSFTQKLQVLVTGVTIPRPENTQTPADLEMEFDVRSIQVPDGTVLEAWHIPHASPRGVVAMFHSYGGCKARLLREASAFHDLGFAIVMIDFRGSGGSTGNETTVGVREADDVTATLALTCTLYPDQPCVLYGRSMGSAAILRAIAVNGVTADAVIIECPFDRLVTTVGNRFTAMGLPANPGAPLLVFWGGVQCNFNGFTHNPADYAREVRCPVLILHGTEDRRVTVAEVQTIFDNLAGPKELVLIDGARHQPYLQTHPDRWTESVTAFLLHQLKGR